MDIKTMSYDATSGGTFTIGVAEGLKIKHNEVGLPTKLGDLLSLLETRIGEPVKNITFQICPTQSLSEERIIINYKINEVTHVPTKTILNVSDMSVDETNKYNEIKTDLGI